MEFIYSVQVLCVKSDFDDLFVKIQPRQGTRNDNDSRNFAQNFSLIKFYNTCRSACGHFYSFISFIQWATNLWVQE